MSNSIIIYIYILLALKWASHAFNMQKLIGRRTDNVWCTYIAILHFIIFPIGFFMALYFRNLLHSSHPFVKWRDNRKLKRNISIMTIGQSSSKIRRCKHYFIRSSNSHGHTGYRKCSNCDQEQVAFTYRPGSRGWIRHGSTLQWKDL